MVRSAWPLARGPPVGALRPDPPKPPARVKTPKRICGEPVRRELTMTAWVENTARALADRKAATSIEYAVIAAGVSTVAACYKVFFNRMVDMLGTIGFS